METSCPSYHLWKKIGLKHHHGIDLPLFSLHSKNSAGIGEIPDLIPVIDWLSQIGMDVLQLLPLNDSASDPSPYNALSAFALHPIYLGLIHLPHVKEDKELLKQIKAIKETNAYPKVAYQEVLQEKRQFLRLYFQKYFKESDPSYNQFYLENKNWLQPYALFKVLKSKFNQKNWVDWPDEYKQINESHYEKYRSKMTFYTFEQYLLASQLSAVKEHAQNKNVLLKGDIPILISPDSTDAWHYQRLFDMRYSAGAPPDMFNPDGQYWGFPTYRWDEMERENYQWWKERLKMAEKFYHLYRIDHVIGFYRIWQIPRGKTPHDGQFVPEDENAAIAQGDKILRMMIDASSMLPIAEDLGFITEKIRNSLKKLGIAGTRVIRWERFWDEKKEYIPLTDYDPINLTTVSTHDSETLELWWKYRADEAKPYADMKTMDYAHDLTFDARFSLLKDSHDSSTLFHVNLLQEYFGLYPELSWPNPEDERINIPGFILPANWTYRFRPSIEEFTSHHNLFKSMQELIKR